MIKTNFEDQEAIQLVDISYCIHALSYTALNEYSIEFDVPKDPEELYKIDFSLDKEYLAIFSKCIISNLKKYSKNLNFKIKDMLLCMDCKKEDIWRMSLYPNYKLHRLIPEQKGINKGHIFKFCFNSLIPKLVENKFCKTLKYSCAEGDDIIAVSKDYIRQKYPLLNILIIASDHDLLQLQDEKTKIINIKNEILNEKSEGPEKELKLKILLGDTGDNINGIFEKTKGDKYLAKGFGVKTAKKFRDDPILLNEMLEKYPKAKELLAINEKIIDFKYIPDIIRSGIIEELNKIL